MGNNTKVSYLTSLAAQELDSYIRSVGAFGLINGGTAGMIYSYIFTFVGFMLVIASMAEMASMAPTSGGQYHWVSEFSPRSAQKFLSYMTGKLWHLST